MILKEKQQKAHKYTRLDKIKNILLCSFVK